MSDAIGTAAAVAIAAGTLFGCICLVVQDWKRGSDDDYGVPHLVDCETSMREDGLPCGCITRDVVEAVMSSLSDHDRAVAADALRQAAAFWDSLTPEAADELFFDVADWLRARAEGQVGGQHTDTPPATEATK